MAKKKKVKKSNIQKRQKAKQQKRSNIKRKEAAKAPKQKKMSLSKVKKSLKNLPSLVFEPEIEALAFNEEQLRSAIETHTAVPDQVDAIADHAYLENMTEAFNLMAVRFQQAGDQEKTMMVQAMLYFISEGNAPACMNQIVVGLFLKQVEEMNNPDAQVDFAALTAMIKAYDEQYQDLLDEKTKQFQPPQSLNTASSAEDSIDDEPVATSALEPLLSEFEAWLETRQEDERALEDAEVLLVDYAEEKGITDLDGITGRKVKSFVEGWFVRTMNPTPEDQSSMLSSLGLFFEFALSCGKIDQDRYDEAKVKLADLAEV